MGCSDMTARSSSSNLPGFKRIEVAMKYLPTSCMWALNSISSSAGVWLLPLRVQ
jgi:hypothetical protein